MPCPDCRPTDAGVELCPYHSQLEQRIATLEALLANFGDDWKERRRYALLQAAALIQGMYIDTITETHLEPTACVDRAEWLLTEIEKREPPEAKR